MLTNKNVNFFTNIVIACFIFVVIAVYLALSYIGFHTWYQAYERLTLGWETILSLVVLLVFAPGGNAVIGMFYLFIAKKGAGSNLVFILSVALFAFSHVLFWIPGSHMNSGAAFLLGLVELAFIMFSCVKLKKYLFSIDS